MKKLFLIVTLLMSVTSFAGNDGRGGGGGVLTNGKVLLLDLFEAAKPKNIGGITESGLNIVESDDPVEVQVERALARLELWKQPNFALKGISKHVREEYQKALKIMRPIGNDYELSFPTDANLKFMPKNMKPVGIAEWETDANDGEVLWVDMKYYNLMNNTHKAALLMHEAIYKVLRSRFFHSKSVTTRYMVGYLFSDVPTVAIDLEKEKNIKVTLRVIEPGLLSSRLHWNKCGFYVSMGNQGLSVVKEAPEAHQYVPVDTLLKAADIVGEPCLYRFTFENETETLRMSVDVDWRKMSQSYYDRYRVNYGFRFLLKQSDLRKGFGTDPYVLDIPLRL